MSLLHTLKQRAGVDDNPDQEGLDQFAQLIIQELYTVCDQAWKFNDDQRNKEGVSMAEQMVFAGAQAQCQKMKENIKELFGVEE